jgi:radical SAM protein with 4Fe4S-binding SPASM domain
MKSSRSEEKSYFCEEPWTGLFTIVESGDVLLCPCYLKMRIGNVHDSSMQEIWNAPELVEIRRSFQRGELPEPCQGEQCPVALGKGS